MRRIHLKKAGCILPVLALLLAMSGCGETGENGTEPGTVSESGTETGGGAQDGSEEEQLPAPDLKTYSRDEAVVYEAEEGTLLGGTSVTEKDGVGYVEGFAKEGDGLKLTIHIDETGF